MACSLPPVVIPRQRLAGALLLLLVASVTLYHQVSLSTATVDVQLTKHDVLVTAWPAMSTDLTGATSSSVETSSSSTTVTPGSSATVTPAISFASQVEHIQELRQKHLREQCKGAAPMSTEMVLAMCRECLVSHELRSIYCPIPKAGATSWKRALGIVTGAVNDSEIVKLSARLKPDRVEANPSTAVHFFPYRVRAGLTRLREFSEKQCFLLLQRYFVFTFVRDPFERLLSAYVDKFHTAGAEDFQRQLEVVLHRKARDITFAIFADYVTSRVLGKAEVDPHWMPATELHHPCYIHFDFIGKLETVEEDGKYVIEHQWGKNRAHVRDLLDPKRGPQSSVSTSRRLHSAYASLDRIILDRIKKTYADDFRLFDYDIDRYF